MTDEELMRLVGPPPVSDELEGNPARRESGSEGTSLTDEQMQALLSSTTPANHPSATDESSDSPYGMNGDQVDRLIDTVSGGNAAGRPNPNDEALSLEADRQAVKDRDAWYAQRMRDSKRYQKEHPEKADELSSTLARSETLDRARKIADIPGIDSKTVMDTAVANAPKFYPGSSRDADDPGYIGLSEAQKLDPSYWKSHPTKDVSAPPVGFSGDTEDLLKTPVVPTTISLHASEQPGQVTSTETPPSAQTTGEAPVVPSEDARTAGMTDAQFAADESIPREQRNRILSQRRLGSQGEIDMGQPVSPEISGVRPGEEPVPDDLPILPSDSPLQKVNKEQINAQLSEERQARALRGIGDQKQLELDRVMQVRQQAVQEQAARQAQFQQAVQRNAAQRDQQIAELRSHVVDPRRLMNQMSAWDVANIGALAALNAGAGGEAAANYLTNAVNADTAYQQSRYSNDQQVLNYLVGQQGEERADQQVRAMAAKEALADSLELEASRMDAGTVKQNTILAVEKMRADLRKEKDSLAIHEESMLVQQARANKLAGGGAGGGAGTGNLGQYGAKWGINEKNQKHFYILNQYDLDSEPIYSATEPTEEFKNRFDTTENGYANAYRLLDRIQYAMSKHNNAKDLSQFLQTPEGSRITQDLEGLSPFLTTAEGSRVNAGTLKIFDHMAGKTPGELSAYLNQSANLAHLREAMHTVQDNRDQHLASFAHVPVSDLRKRFGSKIQLQGATDDDRAEIDGAGKAPPPTPESTDPRVISAAIDESGKGAKEAATKRDEIAKNKARVEEWRGKLKEDTYSFGLKAPEPVEYRGQNVRDAASAYAELATAVKAYRATEGRFMGDSDPYNEVPVLDKTRGLVEDRLAKFLANRPDVAMKYFKDEEFSPPLSYIKVYNSDLLKLIIKARLEEKGRQWQNTMVGNIIRDGGN